MLATRCCGSNTDEDRGFPAEISEKLKVLLPRSHLAASVGIKTKRPFSMNAVLLLNYRQE